MTDREKDKVHMQVLPDANLCRKLRAMPVRNHLSKK